MRGREAVGNGRASAASRRTYDELRVQECRGFAKGPAWNTACGRCDTIREFQNIGKSCRLYFPCISRTFSHSYGPLLPLLIYNITPLSSLLAFWSQPVASRRLVVQPDSPFSLSLLPAIVGVAFFAPLLHLVILYRTMVCAWVSVFRLLFSLRNWPGDDATVVAAVP